MPMFMKTLRELWKRPEESLGKDWNRILIDLRREPVMTRVAKPTRIDRARSLGYKAKKGNVVVRVKIGKGKRKTPDRGRRRPAASGRFFTPGQSHQAIAEQRVARRYPNLEVMNSYMLAEDGKSKWYEVICLDPDSPSVSKDKERKWITEKQHKGRAYRGKTSAARKSRGLRKKGIGAEKLRPSLNARKGRGK
jgi:large subunit ribosomal protein L15e